MTGDDAQRYIPVPVSRYLEDCETGEQRVARHIVISLIGMPGVLALQLLTDADTHGVAVTLSDGRSYRIEVTGTDP